MYKVRCCFEIAGIAQDESGNPVPTGLQVVLGESVKEWPYEDVMKHINIDAIASLLNVKPEDVTIITPEEYDERYGDTE